MAEWSLALGPYVFNIVDVLIVVLAFMGAVVGTVKGFAVEFSVRAGFLVGLIVALIFTKPGTNVIVDTFDPPIFWATLIAFIILFIIGYLVMMMVGSLLGRTLDALKLNWLDRLLGLLLGIVEVLVLVALFVYLLELQHTVDLSAYFDFSVINNEVFKPLTPKGVELVKELL